MGSSSDESRDPSRIHAPGGIKGEDLWSPKGTPAVNALPLARVESSKGDSEPGTAAGKTVAETPRSNARQGESPAIGRLKRRADFLRVAGKRKKWAAPGLVLQVAPQPGPSARRPAPDRPIRVGFTTSKKVGGAVDRNRARRRLRAAVDLVFPNEALLGRDYVVIGRAATVRRPFDLLVADLRAALKRLGARR